MAPIRSGKSLVVLATLWSAVVLLYVVLAIEAVPTVAVPVAACALPLFSHSRESDVLLRWVSVALLSVFILLGLASVGTLYLPAAAAMITAAVKATLKRRGSR